MTSETEFMPFQDRGLEDYELFRRRCPVRTCVIEHLLACFRRFLPQGCVNLGPHSGQPSSMRVLRLRSLCRKNPKNRTYEHQLLLYLLVSSYVPISQSGSYLFSVLWALTTPLSRTKEPLDLGLYFLASIISLRDAGSHRV